MEARVTPHLVAREVAAVYWAVTGESGKRSYSVPAVLAVHPRYSPAAEGRLSAEDVMPAAAHTTVQVEAELYAKGELSLAENVKDAVADAGAGAIDDSSAASANVLAAAMADETHAISGEASPAVGTAEYTETITSLRVSGPSARREHLSGSTLAEERHRTVH